MEKVLGNILDPAILEEIRVLQNRINAAEKEMLQCQMRLLEGLCLEDLPGMDIRLMKLLGGAKRPAKELLPFNGKDFKGHGEALYRYLAELFKARPI